jgi:hypothetical protein
MQDDPHFFTRVREFARYSDGTLRRLLDCACSGSSFESQGTRNRILRAFQFENRQDRRHHVYRALLGAHLISASEYFEAEQDWIGSSSEYSDSEYEDTDNTSVDSDEDMAIDHME